MIGRRFTHPLITHCSPSAHLALVAFAPYSPSPLVGYACTELLCQLLPVVVSGSRTGPWSQNLIQAPAYTPFMPRSFHGFRMCSLFKADSSLVLIALLRSIAFRDLGLTPCSKVGPSLMLITPLCRTSSWLPPCAKAGSGLMYLAGISSRPVNLWRAR